MDAICIKNRLDLPHLGSASVLSSFIKGKTALKGTRATTGELELLWPAKWWGLDNSRFFNRLNKEMQHKILLACNRTVMNEAYFIEKSGLAYSAKMVLLARTTDTAQLYSLIGADEARHLAWIEPYLATEDKTKPCGQFLSFLSQLIETVSPDLLVYLVQIILEGWGLDHYKRLSEGCQNPALTTILCTILKDEMLHHHSGRTLFNPSTLSSDDIMEMTQFLTTYTDMVRCGPQAVLNTIKTVCPDVSYEDIEELLISLGHTKETQRKLTLLQTLMCQPGVTHIVDSLAAEGCFYPLSIREAAELCCKTERLSYV